MSGRRCGWEVTDMPPWLNWFLRRFTKHVVNPITLRRAGRENYQYAALHHVGRKSGRPHVTPLDAQPVQGGFVIPLLYGEDTDWCRNLLAAGKGILDVNGEAIAILNPRVVDLASVQNQLRAAQVKSWTRFGIPQCLRIDRGRTFHGGKR
jgi:deazaflavin-dependent oxidoreductase (nitroreductase family)